MRTERLTLDTRQHRFKIGEGSISLPEPSPILNRCWRVSSVRRSVRIDGGGRSGSSWDLLSCPILLGGTSTLYALWKKDSKKPRGPSPRNTWRKVGRCVARLQHGSETSIQQGQNF